MFGWKILSATLTVTARSEGTARTGTLHSPVIVVEGEVAYERHVDDLLGLSGGQMPWSTNLRLSECLVVCV